MEETKSKKKKINWVLVIIITWLVFVGICSSFLFELSEYNYEYRFIHECSLESVNSTGSATGIGYNISLSDEYCPYCGEEITDDTIYIRSKSICEDCGLEKKDLRSEYCKRCGGKFINAKYVKLSSTEFKTISTVYTYHILKGLCIAFLVVTFVIFLIIMFSGA